HSGRCPQRRLGVGDPHRSGYPQHRRGHAARGAERPGSGAGSQRAPQPRRESRAARDRDFADQRGKGRDRLLLLRGHDHRTWLAHGGRRRMFSRPHFLRRCDPRRDHRLRAADTADRMLREPALEAELGDAYSSFLKAGYDTYARLIYAHYRSQFSIIPTLLEIGVEVLDDGTTTHHAEVIRLISGDFWSKTNELGNRLRARSDMDTFAPFTPDLDCPFYDFA